MTDRFAIRHRNIQIGDIEMFYREAGTDDKPVVLLLHGYPTSSHMFRYLIPQLAGDYRVLAPDLPGFGYTRAPPRGRYDYTFENLYKAVHRFVDALNLQRFALMVFDYGAPVGFRLAAAFPDRISAIISQNGNAYEEGLQENLGPLREYWTDHSSSVRNALQSILTIEGTRLQYTTGVPGDRLDRISPDAIALAQAAIDRDPEVQLDLFRDYGSNVALYPKWQAYFRTHQPPLLAVWGALDPFFKPAGALAFRRDIVNAEIHLLDSGHFALETHPGEIGSIVLDFLDRRLAD